MERAVHTVGGMLLRHKLAPEPACGRGVASRSCCNPVADHASSCDGESTGVVRAVTVKRKTERERSVWDELRAVVGTPWTPTPAAQQDGEEVHAIAVGGEEEPLPVRPAVRVGLGGVFGPRKMYLRAGFEI